MKSSTISTFLLLATAAYAAINGRCTVGSTPGVCISTANCATGGGTSTAGFCPSDPTDIKCCTKHSCGTNGSCKWTDQCSGTTVSNLCPGPSNFKCCLVGDTTPGPIIPVAKCKPHVIAAGKTILQRFPGAVHTVWCYAPGTGDHPFGLALDLMVKPRSAVGREMAEWIMENHTGLRVKYVIWGQKIWNVQRDSVQPWTKWRDMEDRGNDTKNHWDHNHVSFLASAAGVEEL